MLSPSGHEQQAVLGKTVQLRALHGAVYDELK